MVIMAASKVIATAVRTISFPFCLRFLLIYCMLAGKSIPQGLRRPAIEGGAQIALEKCLWIVL
jgi:hypothetical protein